MGEPVKTRRYDASARRAAADERRSRTLVAARELFLTRGYRATTMAAIADRAGVAADTVYASIGPKPAVFRALLEAALSGRDVPVAGRDRDYAVAMRAADTLEQKLRIYADAVAGLQQRLAPLFLVLREAAAGEPELQQLWASITDRRARNMRELTADLLRTGELRTDRSADQLADVIWATNSSELFAQLVFDRGWSPAEYADWLADAWLRLLRR